MSKTFGAWPGAVGARPRLWGHGQGPWACGQGRRGVDRGRGGVAKIVGVHREGAAKAVCVQPGAVGARPRPWGAVKDRGGVAKD